MILSPVSFASEPELLNTAYFRLPGAIRPNRSANRTAASVVVLKKLG